MTGEPGTDRGEAGAFDAGLAGAGALSLVAAQKTRCYLMTR